MHLISLIIIVIVQFILYWRTTDTMAKLSEQVEELKATNADMLSAIEEEKSEVNAKLEELNTQISQLEEKVTELGEVDPDLTDVIDAMKANIEDVKGIVSAPADNTGGTTGGDTGGTTGGDTGTTGGDTTGGDTTGGTTDTGGTDETV